MRLCAERLKNAGVKAIWLCDRGFHRVAWLLTLKNLKQQFVVRLQRDVFVEIDGTRTLLGKLQLRRGEFRDFGWVKLRIDGKVKVRLIGVWAKESNEIWWLATNLKREVVEIVGLYDRRMSIEEQFRDTKGVHFGLKLKWTQFEKSQYLERLYLLLGVASLVWTSVGRYVETHQPKARMRCRKKGARLSLIRIGTLFFGEILRKLKLTTKFIRENLPLPKVRIFNWLQVQQK